MGTRLTSPLADLKKRTGEALKRRLLALSIADLAPPRASTRMRLEGRYATGLAAGCELTLACASVVGGRRPGSFGLYWLLSLAGGPILEAMTATGLHTAPSFAGDAFFAVTSHNLATPSHHEVGPDTDVDAVALDICDELQRLALPIAAAFTSAPEAGFDYILAGRPGRLRNPFTLAAILLHLADRTDRLPELLAAAPRRPPFHDLPDAGAASAASAASEATRTILEPLARWFAQRPR